MRVVEADPNYTPTCRRLNERERVEITLTLRGTRVDDKRPARAVDLPEEGFAVVAYWGREDGKAVAPYALVTGGGHFSDLYPGWVGTHTLAGVAFMDGPRGRRTDVHRGEGLIRAARRRAPGHCSARRPCRARDALHGAERRPENCRTVR